MMEVSGSGGLGEQGLLGAPPAAQKKKPNYMYFTHTPHDTHHTHTTQHTTQHTRRYRSLSSFTPQRRASERLRKYKKTGRYSGTSVLAGRKHKKTPFSFRRKLSRLHTRYDIPYTHTHNNTRGIHKPTVLPIRRKRSAAFTYHSTISTHTPYNIPYTCTQRVYTHSHRKNNRKGSAKAQAYKHHIRHTPTHTRHTVSEGFAFTHPSQGTHEHTWINKSHEPMRFRGRCNEYHTPSSTGVWHTNRPWLRRILLIQGDGKEGVRIELGRHRKWAQITEDRHKGWTNTGMIPNETPKVERYEDFLPFHDWLLQHLGGRQRYILYRINMTSSPHPRCDLERNNWMVTNCPEEITRWEKAIYRVLEQALQNFKPTQHIFLQHRIEHPLGSIRV